MASVGYHWLRHVLFFTVALTVSTGVLSSGLATSRANAAQTMVFKTHKEKTKEVPPEAARLPDHIDADEVDDFMAALSDEQVRRLLIEALKRQAAEEAAATPAKQKMTGIAGFIYDFKTKFELILVRFAALKSGTDTKVAKIPAFYTYLGKGERDANTTRAILVAGAVFLLAFFTDFLFNRYTAAVRRRIESARPADWRAKIGALVLRGLLDLASICVFAAAVLVIFHLFPDRSTPQRVLVATYLAAILIVRAAHLLSRLLLVPRVPPLRFLPLGNETALYLHRWIMAIVTVGSFGLLTCGIFRLAGTSEASYFIMVSLVSLTLAFMFIAMILRKRETVRQALTGNLPETHLRARLAQYWHHFAIAGVILLWIFAVFSRLLAGDQPGHFALKTLLIIPLYFLLDWILRQILEVAFGLVHKSGEPDPGVHTAIGSDPDAMVASGAGPALPEPDPQPATGHLDIDRLRSFVRTGLRVALGFLMFFWILRIWGVNLRIGQEVALAAFDILVVVLVCFVAWELVNAAIKRRLAKEMSNGEDEDDEREEGGSGGSRIATLLVLLRKFMLAVIIVLAALIILSAIGVNIGPLIAGAGVIGLAIGFGAQTLVKDIISGMFFLIDDAFRVGDYVDTGKQKGTVEQVSLRSLRLRHPRGMVYTIPFGDINSVTNFSRDYIITKLDFRVPFDTDVDKVRKIVKKKVYQEIIKDPELGKKLLSPIKSQGVRELDDSALIMRVKYKTPPGEQFAIRKHVYRLMQEAFQEAGLHFAHRNVTVSLPPDIEKSLAHADPDTRKKILEAGAAAAGAAIQAEEEQKEKK